MTQTNYLKLNWVYSFEWYIQLECLSIDFKHNLNWIYYDGSRWCSGESRCEFWFLPCVYPGYLVDCTNPLEVDCENSNMGTTTSPGNPYPIYNNDSWGKAYHSIFIYHQNLE